MTFLYFSKQLPGFSVTRYTDICLFRHFLSNRGKNALYYIAGISYSSAVHEKFKTINFLRAGGRDETQRTIDDRAQAYRKNA